MAGQHHNLWHWRIYHFHPIALMTLERNSLRMAGRIPITNNPSTLWVCCVCVRFKKLSRRRKKSSECLRRSKQRERKKLIAFLMRFLRLNHFQSRPKESLWRRKNQNKKTRNEFHWHKHKIKKSFFGVTLMKQVERWTLVTAGFVNLFLSSLLISNLNKQIFHDAKKNERVCLSVNVDRTRLSEDAWIFFSFGILCSLSLCWIYFRFSLRFFLYFASQAHKTTSKKSLITKPLKRRVVLTFH